MRCSTWPRSTAPPAIPTPTTARSTWAGTERLLEAAARAGVRRFVHTSTVGVHGHVENPPADETARHRPGRHLPGHQGRGGGAGPSLPPRARAARGGGASGRHLRPGRDAAAQALSRDRARPLRGGGHGQDVLPPGVHRRPRGRASCSPWTGRRRWARPSSICGPRYVSQDELAALIARPHGRARPALPHSRGAPPVGGRRRRGDLRSARAGAASPSPARGLLDEEPGVHDREGAAAARLRAQGGPRGGDRADRRVVSGGGMALSGPHGARRPRCARRRPGGGGALHRPRPPARTASSGATARPTTRWRGAWPRTSTCVTRRRTSSASAASSSRSAGSLPEAVERGAALRCRGRVPLDLAACRRRSRGSTTRRPSSIRWRPRPSSASSGRAGLLLVNVLVFALALLARVRRAPAPRERPPARARVRPRRLPRHGRPALPALADAGDLRPRPRHRRPRGHEPRAAAAGGGALRGRRLPEAAERLPRPSAGRGAPPSREKASASSVRGFWPSVLRVRCSAGRSSASRRSRSTG